MSFFWFKRDEPKVYDITLSFESAGATAVTVVRVESANKGLTLIADAVIDLYDHLPYEQHAQRRRGATLELTFPDGDIATCTEGDDGHILPQGAEWLSSMLVSASVAEVKK